MTLNEMGLKSQLPLEHTALHYFVAHYFVGFCRLHLSLKGEKHISMRWLQWTGIQQPQLGSHVQQICDDDIVTNRVPQQKK